MKRAVLAAMVVLGLAGCGADRDRAQKEKTRELVSLVMSTEPRPHGDWDSVYKKIAESTDLPPETTRKLWKLTGHVADMPSPLSPDYGSRATRAIEAARSIAPDWVPDTDADLKRATEAARRESEMAIR